MAYIKRLVVFLLFLLPAFSWAGYAQLTPPPSWSAGTGAVVGAGGAFNASQAVAANAATLSAEGTVLTNASLNVGGRMVTIPASMRFAANAGRFAANFIVANPYVRTGLAIASWLQIGKLVYDEVQKTWVKQVDTYQDASEFGYKIFDRVYSTPEEACITEFTSWQPPDIVARNHVNISTDLYGRPLCEYLPNYSSLWVINKVQVCPTGSVFVNGQCMVKGSTLTPLTPDQAADELGKIPMPPLVPQEVPTPLPVELPKINPVPSPDGDPAPMRIPTGDPVKLPNPDPANQPDQYRKPAIDVVPSPVPGEPWRVDIQPKDVISSDPNKLPENAPVPSNPPSGGDGGDKTQEKVPGFCETNPNSIVCKELKFDKPESDELKKKDVSVQVTPDSGWGGNGQCPAAKTVTVSGQTFEIPFDMICGFLGNIRPVIIAMAWLSALGIMIGGFRESSAAR